MKNRDIHLICNAHLDPVWLWQWQEGLAETLSTFRVAAEFCENSQTFIFNHNEAILYKWIEEHDPELFKRIQVLVKKGQWHIMGGWFLQPDCNMPAGESFVRQILVGKMYFKEKFGVNPTTAINFDPFGHSQGLVQILAKSGYDSYLFGRPELHCIDLPAEDFRWVGYDGSEIMATRFPGWYNTLIGKAKETIKERSKIDLDRNPMPILWGIGNHGGGPSKIDLHDIEELIGEEKDCNIRHSSPEKYFKQLKKNYKNLPQYNSDLNPWAIGCYSSQIRIKQQHRLLENEYYSTEKIVSTAVANGLMDYPVDKMQEALEDLLTSQFHDILPGSSIEPAEEDALRQLGHGLEIISRVKAKAFLKLTSGQKKAKAGLIPIMVLNHHPFVTDQIVECEFNLADYNSEPNFTDIEVYQNGKLIPSQVERQVSNHPVEWRKKIVFYADLKAAQVNRFDCKPNIIDKQSEPILAEKNGKIRFKTDELSVVINTATGLVDSYKVEGVDYLKKNAFELLVVKDNIDAWNMLEVSFAGKVNKLALMNEKENAKFAGVHKKNLASVRVIEDGAVRSVVEALFKYNNSFICQRYKLPKFGTEIEVETRVHWNEKDCILKLAAGTKAKEPKYIGQVAYGVSELPQKGREVVSQKYSAVVSDLEDKAFTCINKGTYASDFNKGLLRLTLLRSSAYTGHNSTDSIPDDRYVERMDQGLRVFKFWFNAGKVNEMTSVVDRHALVKNETPFALSFFPSGFGEKPKPLALLSDKVIQITTIKKAENNNDFIVRLYEPTGSKRTTTLSMPIISAKFKLKFLPFEIKTLRINSKTKKITEVDLLEKKK